MIYETMSSMKIYLLIIVFINFAHYLYCFDENVWETYDTNDQNVPKFTETSKQLYETGKNMFEVMAKKETMYGNCWRNAIQSLDTNCKHLTEESQSRLAITFANCFLEKSGQKTYPCNERQDIKECFKHIDNRFFDSYTEFFTHTQSICFYLQTELWQQKTESTVDKLTQTAANVKNRLEDASKQLDQLNGLQELSIGSQMRLNEELTTARNTINEFKDSSAEQRFIVKEILDRFIRLQDFILIEVSYGYSIIFFIISIIIVYFITTPIRTNEARLWLFLVLICNLFAERIIASYSVDDQLVGLTSTSIIISERIWISRKVTLLLMTAIFLWFAITYKDYNYVNYSILNEHTMRLNHIQEQLRQITRIGQYSPQKLDKSVDTLDNEYSSGTDSDFSVNDSDYSTDDSDVTNASFETCSTVTLMSQPNTYHSSDCFNLLDKMLDKENSDSFTITGSSPSVSKPYDLRPRRAITYTKNGIIDESVNDFIEKVKISEKISKLSNRQFNKSLFSSDED
ncbi:uncharacterized protein LOC128961678 [Oppia nitens]|uniref:uncharacterized protein LOC128961678 n=1 Tax=Oppia nitens TaxID=1686743 RepID=UPI0023DB185B|nr:uncharacterized protein LOC128961678 [Oppia nitens]